MILSFHCNSYGGHLRLNEACFAWRNALPRFTPIYGNGYERLYGSFGETIITLGSFTFHFY